MDRIKNKESFLQIGAVVGILVYMMLIFWANIFHFNYRMNSDIASDVILGELIWKSKEVIPNTWYVANEARIICNPNVAALLMPIVRDMNLAAGMGCCIMSVLIVLSIFYFCKAVGMKKSQKIWMGFLCLGMPAGFIILELLYLFASYYAVHVVIFFVTMAIYADIMKGGKVKAEKLLAGMVLAFVLGIQGVRGILVIYGPLFGIEIVRNLYFVYCGQKRERKDIILSGWTAALLMVSFWGTCFPISVGQTFSRNIRGGFPKLFTVVIPDMARAVGFENAHIPARGCLVILLFTALYVLVNILGRMYRRENIKTAEWAWLVFCSSPVLTALMVAFTTVESTQRYYFMLPFLLAYSPIMLWGQERVKLNGVALAAAAVLTVLNIFQIYIPVISANEPPESEERQVTEFLAENEYLTAYATFENANKMTVLSNGSVRVYPVATVEKMDICKWMTSTDWYCPNMPYEHKTAYVFTEAEKEEFGRFLDGKQDSVKEAARIGKYNIYISDYNFSNLGGE
jgi:hypothetical protein